MIPTTGLRYAIALSLMKGMNQQAAERLLPADGDMAALFDASPESWREKVGTVAPLFDLESRQRALAAADTEIRFIEQKNITPLFFTDPDYPALLHECPDAPLMLYFKGEGNPNPHRVLSIVGTRKATRYGRDFCTDLLADLSLAVPGLTIVSGMAYGIDICAHREALKNGLPTIGVLAHGLHTLYPSAHRATAQEAERHGGLLTEYTSQQPILKINFVARNRIVAGMSEATLVVESAEKGGALITARLARDYNRDVFALPGNIGQESSAGCNRLIHDNIAALVTSAADIVEALGWETSDSPKECRQQPLFPDISEKEALILRILQDQGEIQINPLTVTAGLPAGEVLSTLLEMEFKGLVRTLPGGIFRVVK